MENESNKKTAVDWLIEKLTSKPISDLTDEEWFGIMGQAKEMDKEKHEKFNKFLNDEKQLGISDLKTIERIQWYYNTYFNETYGGKDGE